MTPKKGKVCYLCRQEQQAVPIIPLGGRFPIQAFPAEQEALEAFRLASRLALGLTLSFHRTEKKICSVTRRVEGRLGAAVLLNGGLILSVVEESTGAGWRITELIFPALPEGPSALSEPFLLPGASAQPGQLGY